MLSQIGLSVVEGQRFLTAPKQVYFDGCIRSFGLADNDDKDRFASLPKSLEEDCLLRMMMTMTMTTDDDDNDDEDDDGDGDDDN